MFVIKLPNGNLLVPESALSSDGIVADAYVEIGPDDSEYSRLAAGALPEQEAAQRRRRWQDGDEALWREFEAFRAGHADQGRLPGGESGGASG